MSGRRKRSAAITLVLAGSLGGCGEPELQRDVYTSLANCQRDWGQPQQCQTVRDNRYPTSYVYGPGYFGSAYPSGRARPSAYAYLAEYPGRPLDQQSRTFTRRFFGGSSTGSLAPRGGAPATTARGGFGSTASSFSSGG